MQVKIFDTHVKTIDDRYYHFDVVVTDKSQQEVEDFAKQYLSSIGVEHTEIVQNSCKFCHNEVASKDMQDEIDQNEFYIIPMQGCP